MYPLESLSSSPLDNSFGSTIIPPLPPPYGRLATAPDVNTNGQIMSWMIDEFNVLTGEQGIGTLTGKPLELGGSLGRTQATGYGVALAAKLALEKLGKSTQGAKFAVQGFGNVGSYTVKTAVNFGAKVVAVT